VERDLENLELVLEYGIRKRGSQLRCIPHLLSPESEFWFWERGLENVGHCEKRKRGRFGGRQLRPDNGGWGKKNDSSGLVFYQTRRQQHPRGKVEGAKKSMAGYELSLNDVGGAPLRGGGFSSGQ